VLAAWEVANGNTELDEAAFTIEILPKIRGVSLSATRLSPQHCSPIRRGLKVPHPRHWESLTRLHFPSNGSRDELEVRILRTGASPPLR
jgi:hypothetical protein